MTRVALFAVFLALVGLGAAGVGSLVGGGAAAAEPAAMEMGELTEGLATSAAGYTLETERSGSQIRLRIRDDDGRLAHDFDREGGVLLHLIVARRDLAGAPYLHLHPALQADGSWLAPLRLRPSGLYRAFADFEVDGRKIVLGTDLVVPGWTAAPQPLRVTSRAQAGPYAVTLSHGALRAGEDSSLRFAVAGASSFQTYVGARGHLVALHAGDLAYTHVHPTGGTGGDIVFDADFVRAGAYRLFLQFKRDGRVYTAPFVVEVVR